MRLPITELFPTWFTTRRSLLPNSSPSTASSTPPYKLVVKMSGTQSVGIANGWSKTVIVSPGMEDDWGQADVTKLYFKTIGVEPVPGQKVFVESYWMDTVTGFAGQVLQDVAIVTRESPSEQRVRATMDDLATNEENHVSSLDVYF